MYNTNRFVLQERGDFTWRVSDCEELVGLVQETKYETLWQVLMHKCIKNYKCMPRGGVATRKWSNQRFIQQETLDFLMIFLWHSCDTSLQKKEGKDGKLGEIRCV